MKHSYFYAAALKTFSGRACFVSFLIMASLTDASAQKLSDSSAVTPASVSYVGYIEDQFCFLMKYENKAAEKFTITVTDSEGNLLYNENYTSKKFSKVFKTHLETGSLTFVISNPAKKEEKKFRVNTERHIAEEFSVTKAN